MMGRKVRLEELMLSRQGLRLFAAHVDERAARMDSAALTVLVQRLAKSANPVVRNAVSLSLYHARKNGHNRVTREDMEAAFNHAKELKVADRVRVPLPRARDVVEE